MTDDTERPRRADHVDDVVLDESTLEVATFDERNDAINRLNSAAGVVWLLCDGRSTVAEIVGELVTLFGLDPEVARTSVDDAVAGFRRHGLLADERPGDDDDGRTADPDDVRTLAREPDP